MVDPGQISGRYNIIVEGAYEVFDHRMPIEEFVRRLEDDDAPEMVTVVGLDEVLEDGDLADKLARKMNWRTNDREYQN